MVGFGPEMLRKVGIVWLIKGAQPNPGFPDLANAAKAPVKTSRTPASWTKLVFRLNPTHVSGKFVSLSVPGRPKNWLPFVDEVVGMSHTMLMDRELQFRERMDISMSVFTVCGTPSNNMVESCAIENCPLWVRMYWYTVIPSSNR